VSEELNFGRMSSKPQIERDMLIALIQERYQVTSVVELISVDISISIGCIAYNDFLLFKQPTAANK